MSNRIARYIFEKMDEDHIKASEEGWEWHYIPVKILLPIGNRGKRI